MITTKTKPGPSVSLSLKRHYKASPERVFAAWTTPELLARWMAPRDDFAPTVAEVDLRPGGRYRFAMSAPNGDRPAVSGTFVEIVPGEKLVFTWAWAHMPDCVSLVTVTLAPKDDGTELTLHHERFADDEAKSKHAEGWSGCLGRLARVVEI